MSDLPTISRHYESFDACIEAAATAYATALAKREAPSGQQIRRGHQQQQRDLITLRNGSE